MPVPSHAHAGSHCSSGQVSIPLNFRRSLFALLSGQGGEYLEQLGVWIFVDAGYDYPVFEPFLFPQEVIDAWEVSEESRPDLEDAIIVEPQVLLSQFVLAEDLNGEVEGAVVIEEECGFTFITAGGFTQLVTHLAHVSVDQHLRTVPRGQSHHCLSQQRVPWCFPPQTGIEFRQQELFEECRSEVFSAVVDHLEEISDPATHLLPQQKVQVFQKTFTQPFFKVSSSFCPVFFLFRLLQKTRGTFMQVTDYDPNYPESVISQVFPRQDLIQHPDEHLPQLTCLIGEEHGHAMEVCGQEEFIRDWGVEEGNVEVTEGVHTMMGSSQTQYPIEVIQQSVQQLFAAGLGKFYEGLPEANTIGLALQDDALQLLVDLPHHIHCYHSRTLVLCSQRVDEEFDDS